MINLIYADLWVSSLNSICCVFNNLMSVSLNKYVFVLPLNLHSNSSRYASICLAEI
jgi:hypothetical protein